MFIYSIVLLNNFIAKATTLNYYLERVLIVQLSFLDSKSSFQKPAKCLISSKLNLEMSFFFCKIEYRYKRLSDS